MGVNSLPRTVTRQRRSCDLNRGPSAPESSTLTTRLPSHPDYLYQFTTFDHTISLLLLSILLFFLLLQAELTLRFSATDSVARSVCNS